MPELRLAFSPHDILGAPKVQKAIVIDQRRVVFKFDGQESLTEYRTDYARRGHTYRIGASMPNVESVSFARGVRTIHFHLHAGPNQTAVYSNLTTLPIFHYIAPGETAIVDAGARKIVDVVPPFDSTLLARRMCPRLTFAAHHFMRNVPPPVAPRLFSRHHDLARDMVSISTAETEQNDRYDNVCNYFRFLIGFLWRECQRHINLLKTPPSGEAPVKTMEEVERILDAVEISLMGQSAHEEHGTHAAGAHQHDPHIFDWYASHDRAEWQTTFYLSQIWLADGDTEPTEKIYDIKAENTDDEGVVDTTALANEEAEILIHSFNKAFSSSFRDLGFTETTIYLP